MAVLSTGPIENSIVAESGLRSTQRITVRMVNHNLTDVYHIWVQGYHLSDVRTLYVEELFSVLPNQMITKDYDANFDAVEFNFYWVMLLWQTPKFRYGEEIRMESW